MASKLMRFLSTVKNGAQELDIKQQEIGLTNLDNNEILINGFKMQ